MRHANEEGRDRERVMIDYTTRIQRQGRRPHGSHRTQAQSDAHTGIQRQHGVYIRARGSVVPPRGRHEEGEQGEKEGPC